MTVQLIELTGAIANGPAITKTMSKELTMFELSSLVFYSDAGFSVKATPSNGAVKVLGTSDDEVWSSVDRGDFSAVDVYSADRTKPNAYGFMSRAKIEFIGVQGVTHYKLIVWRK
jgi:hypothetical protein